MPDVPSAETYYLIADNAYKPDNPPNIVAGYQIAQDASGPIIASATVGPITGYTDGFDAIAYVNADGQVIIGFGGTSETADFAQDSLLYSGIKPQQFTDAENFFQRVLVAFPSAQIFVTGHSLGAALADYVASLHPDKIVDGQTFAPPGIGQIPDVPSLFGPLLNWVNQSDPVGMFQLPEHVGSTSLIGTPSIWNTIPVPTRGQIETAVAVGGVPMAIMLLKLAVEGLEQHKLETYGQLLNLTFAPATPSHSLNDEPGVVLEALALFDSGSLADIQVIDGNTIQNGSLTFHVNIPDDTATIQGTTHDGTAVNILLVGGDDRTFTGGQGNQLVVAIGDRVNLQPQGQNDTLIAFGNDDTLAPSAFSDTFYADSGSDVLTGDVGGDLFYYRQPFDSVTGAALNAVVTIDGGGGNDTLDFASTVDAMLGDGNDLVLEAGHSSTIDGGDGNDTIHADGGGDSILAGNGNDLIYYNSHFDRTTMSTPYGATTIDGGAGNDTVIDDPGPAIINLGDGNDSVRSAGYGSVIDGGAGNDTINMGPNVLVVNAEAGDRISWMGVWQAGGGLRDKTSEDPYAFDEMGFLRYGINVQGDLVIKDPFGRETFIHDYVGGPGAPFDSAGIFVGETSGGVYRMFDTWPKEGSIVGWFDILKAWFKIEGLADPLVLDLNGDGIGLTAESIVAPSFDIDGDQFAEHTGWVGRDDGFLVYDKNNNGAIDDVSELFGGPTVSGFSALAAYDSNNDGVIDSSDTIFSSLRVWRNAA